MAIEDIMACMALEVLETQKVALLSSLDICPSNKRHMPWTNDKKSLMRKVMKIAFITLGQIGKVLAVVLVNRYWNYTLWSNDL